MAYKITLGSIQDQHSYKTDDEKSSNGKRGECPVAGAATMSLAASSYQGYQTGSTGILTRSTSKAKPDGAIKIEKAIIALDQAIKQEVLPVALSLAVQLNDARLEGLGTEQARAVQKLYKQLMTLCPKAVPSSPPDDLGVPLTLTLLNNHLLCPEDKELLTRTRQEFCEGSRHDEIEARLNALESVCADNFDQASADIRSLYYLYRSVMGQDQMQRLVKSFRQVLPALLDRCLELSESDPSHAGFILQDRVLRCLEMLTLCLEGDDKTLNEKTADTICTVLARCLQKTTGKLSRRKAVAFHSLTSYCSGFGFLSQSQEAGLRALIREKSVEAQYGTEGCELLSQMETFLGAGQSREAFDLAAASIHENGEVWNGKKARELNGCFKRALKGELACLCLEIGQKGFGDADVLSRACEIFEKIQIVAGLPWLVGRESDSLLNILRTEIERYLLDPQWEKIKRKGASEDSIKEMELLAQRYKIFLTDEQLGDIKDFKEQVNLPKVSSAVVQEASPESTTKEQTAASQREHDAFSVAQPGIKLQPKTVAEQREYFHVNERALKEFLCSHEQANAFRQTMNRDRIGNLAKGGCWLAFIKEQYTAGKYPPPYTDARKAFRNLVTGAASAVIEDLFQRTKAFRKDGVPSYHACKEVARSMVEFYPLQYIFHDYLQKDYRILLQIVYAGFLIPLKDNIRAADKGDSRYSSDDFWDLLSDAYDNAVLYGEPTRKLFREVYTKNFFCDPAKIYRMLGSGLDVSIEDAIDELETIILDRHHFYSWRETRLSCESAVKLIKAAQSKLENLASRDPGKWNDIQERFLQKVKKATFLHYPPKHHESQPQHSSGNEGGRVSR